MVVDTPNRLTIAVIVVVSIQMIFSFFIWEDAVYTNNLITRML
jgi:hypothetical protein